MKRINCFKILLAVVIFASIPQKTVDANGLNYFDDEIPVDVQAACNIYGAQYDICPELLEAIAYHESRYLPDVENGTCKGVMQINISAHKKRMEKLNVDNIFDINSNVLIAADYLAELFAENDDPAIVLALYHGEKNAEKRTNAGNLSSYVREILELSAKLERKHGK